MTEKIFCKNCNLLLYYGEIIKHRLYMSAIPSEENVLKAYDSTCPRCGNALNLNTVKIEIEEAPWL